MKRLPALMLALVFVWNLAACSPTADNHSTESLPPFDHAAPDSDPALSFSATVLEVHENHLLVEPHPDSIERRSCDRIEIPLAGKTSWPIPAVGDTVHIFYSDGIQETYPARIANVHRVEIEASP
ncbi:MAG: hypothetical protein IJN46_01895 [Lachnospiraceae bacterium]|nr:hypothetical protein [Lachnospiraceae bacterium]